MLKLYDHQRKIIDEDPRQTGLWLSTGSAKTAIALHLARGKTLVICPKTQKEDRNFEREAQKHKISLDLTVISKENFKKVSTTLRSYNTVIVDESHSVCGVTPNIRWVKKQPVPRTSQLFESLELYLQRTKPERLYLLSATPIRSPMTVWGAAKLLGRNWNFYEFRNAFFVKLPMPGRDVYAPKKDKETKERLAKAVQSLGYVGKIDDYVDMPPQIFKVDYLELTPRQKSRIKEMSIEFPDPLTRSLKIHMIENGCLNGDEFSEDESFENQKIDRILDYSIEFPRMVIFARYKTQIVEIARALEETGKKVFILTGDTRDRGKLILEAKNTPEYAFICQSSVGVGWELSDCPVAIFASLDWSLVSYIQAIGRISRINNPKRNLYINLVIKEGIDNRVYKTVVETKMDFHLEMYNDNI